MDKTTFDLIFRWRERRIEVDIVLRVQLPGRKAFNFLLPVTIDYHADGSHVDDVKLRDDFYQRLFGGVGNHFWKQCAAISKKWSNPARH